MLLPLAPHPPLDRARPALGLPTARREPDQAGRWNGYLLDLSDRPYKTAMGLLNVLPKTTAAPVK